MSTFKSGLAVLSLCCLFAFSSNAQSDSVRHKVFFESGSSTLNEKAVKFIDSVAKRFKRYSKYKIYLHGHTDDVGSPETNALLAKKRVEIVMSKLLSIGIDTSRVFGKSFGEENPLFSNTTEQNRSLNRRVDISLVRWDKDTTIKLGSCGEIYVPKGAFAPFLIEDVDFSSVMVGNQEDFNKSGLPSTDAAGTELISAGMASLRLTIDGKPAKRNPKKSIEFRLCNKYNVNKVATYCLNNAATGKTWGLISAEPKFENGKIIVKMPDACDYLNFTINCGDRFFSCKEPFMLDRIPAEFLEASAIQTDNFIYTGKTEGTTFSELPTTCDRIQKNVHENISNEQYIAKGLYINVGNKNKETNRISGKALFVLAKDKKTPSYYSFNQEAGSWETWTPTVSKVYAGPECFVLSIDIPATGIYAIVDSLGGFEKSVNFKTKKYKPETVFIHYKPQLKKGKKAIVTGPMDEHFFKFDYATSLPVLGENNNNVIMIADTDKPEAMKISKNKITDLRYKRKKQYYLVKKKQFSATTDTSSETSKLCKGKKRK